MKSSRPPRPRRPRRHPLGLVTSGQGVTFSPAACVALAAIVRGLRSGGTMGNVAVGRTRVPVAHDPGSLRRTWSTVRRAGSLQPQ